MQLEICSDIRSAFKRLVRLEAETKNGYLLQLSSLELTADELLTCTKAINSLHKRLGSNLDFKDWCPTQWVQHRIMRRQGWKAKTGRPNK